jgi:hypothetical protein
MNSRQIRTFEEKVKEKLGIDVELCAQEAGNIRSYYVYHLSKELLEQEKRPLTVLQRAYQHKPYLFYFNTLNHPNCGMDIIQNISALMFNKDVSKEKLIELFKFTLRTIYPAETNKHSFFSFQQPIHFNLMEELGFKKLVEYKNYNHANDPNRAIWLLDLSKYKDLTWEEPKKEEEKKPNLKTKRAAKKATKSDIVKQPITRRKKVTTKEFKKELEVVENELIEGLERMAQEDYDYNDYDEDFT